MATKKLTCKHCGATMELDEDKEVLYCPYCGSKELVENKDNTVVKLAKMYVNEKHRKEDEEKAKQEENKAKWEALSPGQKAIRHIGIFLFIAWPIILMIFMTIFYTIRGE